MSSRATRWVAAVAAVVGLVATAGCGDDEDDASDDTSADETTPTDDDGGDGDDGGDAAAELTAYCEAELAIETAPEPEVDFETATPEEQATALRTYASETLRPLAEDVAAAAPEEVAGHVEVMQGAVDEVATSGDPAVFEQADVAEAADELHEFDLDNCGWGSHEVTATEYAFEGVPDEVEAGPTSFDLDNEGQEIHELLLVRKNDGVTATAEELLALPEEEALAQVTMVGAPAFAPPDEDDYMVADLEPGDYIAVCFIPTGMTSEEQPPPQDALPHALEGMYAEFTVS